MTTRRPAVLSCGAVLGLLMAIACAREAREPARPPSGAPAAAATAAPATHAPTPSSLPLFSRATCDTVVAALHPLASTHVTVVPDTVNMPEVARPETWPRRGCLVALDDTSASSGDAPNPSLESWFQAHGWVQGVWYSADGPDGTSFAYVRQERICLVKGSWDGGDDSDSTYVPAPGFQLSVFCGPAITADTATVQ